jgi:N utilization substance protein A
VRESGVLEAFGLDAADAEALIVRARVAMGWIEAPPEPEPEPEEPAGEYDDVFSSREAVSEDMVSEDANPEDQAPDA